MIRLLEEEGLDPAMPHLKSQLALVTSKREDDDTPMVDVDAALGVLAPDSVLVRRIKDELKVPDWSKFTDTMDHIAEDVCSKPAVGQVASYISVLANEDPDRFGMAICSVDGQMYAKGDASYSTSIQACITPFLYALAVEEKGVRRTHRIVGYEPSGLSYSAVSLNGENKPHNPLINSGAMACCALIRQDLESAPRFNYLTQVLRAACGNIGRVGFSNPTYLAERDASWRNSAIMYYMMDAGVFPADVSPEAMVDFFLQCCSITASAEQLAVMAATMATGGTCPVTKERVFSSVTIKSVLTLMFSCGMYDFSGEWCVQVGLPCKCGASGLSFVVVPHVMGIAILSPPVDSYGNSARAIEVCRRLVKRFNFGIFDQAVTGFDGESFQDYSAGNQLSYKIENMSAEEAKAQAEFDALADIMSDKDGASGAGDSSGATGARESKEHDGPRARGIRTRGRVAFGRGLDDETDDTQVQQRRATRIKATAACLRKLGTLKLAFDVVANEERAHWCPIDNLIKQLRQDGIDVRRAPAVKKLLQSMIVASRKSSSVPPVDPDEGRSARSRARRLERNAGLTGSVWFPALIIRSFGRDNIVVRSLLGQLVVANFQELRDDLCDIAENVVRTVRRQGSVVSFGEERRGGGALWCADPDAFGVAVCTVDGQMFGFGDHDEEVPVMSTVKPILYALAMHEAGPHTLSNWVSSEPTSLDPNGFGLLDPEPGRSAGDAESMITEATMKAELDIIGEVDEISSVRDTATSGESKRHSDGDDTVDDAEASDRVSPLKLHRGGAPAALSTLTDDSSSTSTSGRQSRGNSASRGGGGADAKPHPARGSRGRWDDASVQPGEGKVGTPEDDEGVEPHSKPYNPFMNSGALAVISVLSLSQKRRSRHFRGASATSAGNLFSSILKSMEKWCGRATLDFSNLQYLAMKEHALRILAVSHYMKGMGSYPPRTDPTSTANMLFQTYSVKMSASKLAVVGATLAAIGECPLTRERCIAPGTVRDVLSLMYTCGMNQYSGRWNFRVGIPAVTGESGLLLIVIPNRMGLVIYSPRVARDTLVPPRGVKFAEMLTRRYRINMFDQLVARSDMSVDQAPTARSFSVTEKPNKSKMFFELCSACSAGDAATVNALLSKGADVSNADDSLRTALHIAATDGHVAVVKELLAFGADILAVDAMGMTPYAAAVYNGHRTIKHLMDDELHEQGRDPPVIPEALLMEASTDEDSDEADTPVDAHEASGGAALLEVALARQETEYTGASPKHNGASHTSVGDGASGQHIGDSVGPDDSPRTPRLAPTHPGAAPGDEREEERRRRQRKQKEQLKIVRKERAARAAQREQQRMQQQIEDEVIRAQAMAREAERRALREEAETMRGRREKAEARREAEARAQAQLAAAQYGALPVGGMVPLGTAGFAGIGGAGGVGLPPVGGVVPHGTGLVGMGVSGPSGLASGAGLQMGVVGGMRPPVMASNGAGGPVPPTGVRRSSASPLMARTERR